MGTQKYELTFDVKTTGGRQRKTVVVDVDDSLLPRLQGSSTKNETIAGLVQHMYPGAEITGGIASRYREKPKPKESNPQKSKSKKSTKESQPVNDSDDLIHVFRKPYYWIPFRLLWAIIKGVFSLIFSILRGILKDP